METVKHYLVHGTLSVGGSWGGEECAKAVTMDMHQKESAFWVVFLILLFIIFNLRRRFSALIERANLAHQINSHSSIVESICDNFLGFLHLAMYLQLIYYKFNIYSLINLIQPCHVILLLQGVSLLSKGSSGTIITILLLPSLTGTLLAMLFPDTSGLDQPYEELSYWLQHYLIQTVPLYLIARKNFLALKLCNFSTVTLGIWILAFLHWTLYEYVDVYFLVNVEFMLCPTGAMNSIFSQLPSWLFWPSYRSLLCVVVFFVGYLIAGIYILIGSIHFNLFGKKDSLSKKSK